MSNIITAENLGKTVRDTLAAERKVTRNYDAMVEFFTLTPESDSKQITACAQAAVLAAYPGTDPERLVGKNKNDDQRWKDARAVRYGLVSAIKRAAGTNESDESEQVVNLLTRAGLKAELADVIAAWKAANENN